MSESPAVIETDHLVVPATGEIVDLNDEVSCAQALDALRQFENQIREAKTVLTTAICLRSMTLGAKTIHLPNGFKAVVKGGSETVYDAEEIEAELRAAGMPEERIREIIVETVTYKVKAVEAKHASGANPEYARIIEAHKRTVTKDPYVSIEH